MEEQIGTKESTICLVEKQASVPAVRHVWRCQESQAMTSNLENFSIVERVRWPIGEIGDHHHGANQTANGLACGSDFQPLIQRSALIRFEVAKSKPADS